MRVPALILLGAALARTASGEVSRDQLQHSLKPDRWHSTVSGVDLEPLGVKRLREYLFAADGAFLYLGDTDKDMVVGRYDRMTKAHVVIRRFRRRDVDATVEAHFAALNYYDDGARLVTRVVLVRRVGQSGPKEDEETSTTIEVIGATGQEIGKSLGTMQIGMADIAEGAAAEAATDRLHRYPAASMPKPGEPQGNQRPGRRVEARLVVADVNHDHVPDLLAWQRHYVSPLRDGPEGLILEGETWKALQSREGGGALVEVLELKEPPDPCAIPWTTLDVTRPY